MTLARIVTLFAAIGIAVICDANTLSMAQVGALSTDCKAVGFDEAHRTYQMVATCAGKAISPNGRYAIVQRAYRDRQPPILLQDTRGRTLMRLTMLSDDMPFAVLWSPDSHWIAVNHHVGSFMDRLHLFEMVGDKAVERSTLIRAARHVVTRRYPCLTPDAVLPNALRWSKDGHHLVMVTISSLYACSDTAKSGDWWPLWMIGDVRTGKIDVASVRVDKADGPLHEPRDLLYRGF
ncbi:hypothetical protein Q5H91_11650 [Sphingomonas sp. KR1UV-12]|uniref:Uncharacterized protein n=1 Tax=Sphingomonas aurea TaxID=3063994 RepID=A0ABT9EM34_9SPHN|nr:hypothetical protein [Sphingomonas sp. KR1UV-12]MDP1027871.1 hypothetical protein [Sphingomonas sp. KR1UV-12]